MMKRVLILFLIILPVACNSVPARSEAVTETIASEKAAQATTAPTIPPLPTPTRDVLLETILIFQQDFESGSPEGGSDEFTDWQIMSDETGNHFYCNKRPNLSTPTYFGHDDWKNYIVEIRVKDIEHHEEPYVSLLARWDAQNYEGYYGALNFESYMANLSYNSPYQVLGSLTYRTMANTWYKLRMEVNGEQLKFLVDDKIVGNAKNSTRVEGRSGFAVNLNHTVCIDDIRVWSLDKNIDPATLPNSVPEGNFEVTKIYPQVWSHNSPHGTSYEYKVNCSNDYSILETCFLWDIDQVVVTSPDGKQFSLEKDFNIQKYSGETTRRWVLYGPIGAGLPINGIYTFSFVKEGSIILSRKLKYEEKIVPFPEIITVLQEGNGLHVTWQPAQGKTPEMDYKVIIFDDTTGQLAASQSFPSNSKDVFLPDLPLIPGRTYRVYVATFSHIGFSESEPIPLKWATP